MNVFLELAVFIALLPVFLPKATFSDPLLYIKLSAPTATFESPEFSANALTPIATFESPAVLLIVSFKALPPIAVL